MECPLRSNGNTRVFVWDSYKENGDTQDSCVTFTQRKVGKFHSEKEAKRCGSPHNIRVMYEINGKKEVCNFKKMKEYCLTVTQN